MKITYIHHSGFLVETEKSYMLFDYFKGTIPELDKNKRLYVFSSHSHPDHFNKHIFELNNDNTTYILSKDIKKKDCNEIYANFVEANKEYTFGDLKVTTLKSTDIGVAFLVETEGKAIYHAGDLNDWAWAGESKAYNNNMTTNYRREIGKMKDITIDVAFVPIDPRQEENYYRGAKYFIENINVNVLFPMHFWDNFSIIKTFKDSYKFDNTKIIDITADNQSWIL